MAGAQARGPSSAGLPGALAESWIVARCGPPGCGQCSGQHCSAADLELVFLCSTPHVCFPPQGPALGGQDAAAVQPAGSAAGALITTFSETLAAGTLRINDQARKQSLINDSA